MNKKEMNIASELLEGTGVSLVDAARIIKNILDFKEKSSKISNLQFCSEVASCGLRHLHIKQMSIKKGFLLYLEEKKPQLRPDSYRDIKYLGSRLLKSNEEFANMNFSQLSINDILFWINSTFSTPSGFNKAHAFLSGLFSFAIRSECLEKNIVFLIPKKKIKESQIKALSIKETNNLLKIASTKKYKNCLASVAILIYGGVRPRELTRLTWQDIDLEEEIITIKSHTSKTGGTRHIEICPALKYLLNEEFKNQDGAIVPKNWKRKWKALRDKAGFKGSWVQDVLRHTYASYHAKHYKNLHTLQLNMGHSNTNLLRSRYVNLKDIKTNDAKNYFTTYSFSTDSNKLKKSS